MAFNELLAKRIRAQLDLYTEDFTEKKMFGGLSFLYKGKMTVGIIDDDLVVRVVPEKMNTELSLTHARPMAFTGKPMKEFIFVSPEGIKTEEELLRYIELGLEHARTKV